MSKRDIDSLLNRGKYYVCQYITSGCYEPSTEKTLDGPINLGEKHLQNHDHRRVHHVIDHLFDYRHHFSAEELTEWIKYMVGGRRLPNTFAREVKNFDTSSKCGLVWTTNFVAFRCRTCAISLCMSLCTDCFLSGNHVGHDFNMFRSQAGGACDCGDSFVMKPEGFCQNHQSKCSDHNKQLPPNSLLCIANEMVPKLLFYLVLYLRENNFSQNKKANALLSDVFIYLNDLGTMMQDIICRALTDPILYKDSLNTVNKEDDLDYQHRIRSLADNYRRAVQEIQLSSIFPNLDASQICCQEYIQDLESFKPELEHKTFLDEIIFWTILNEFPSNLITFLLKMLPNEEYKLQFAESFVKHYFRIAMLILHPTERFIRNSDRDIYYNKLANAVVHVSVQLFSNENLAFILCDRLKLLYIIIISLKFAIEGNRKDFLGILIPNKQLNPMDDLDSQEPQSDSRDDLLQLARQKQQSLGQRIAQRLRIEYHLDGAQTVPVLVSKSDPNVDEKVTPLTDDSATPSAASAKRSVPLVVSCDHSILRLHRFWPIISDLNNLFTHERIALSFLRDNSLIDLYLEFISSFQAMNLNRKLSEAEDDNQYYKASYLSELEICSAQMWTLISHLKDMSTSELTVNITRQSLKWLQKWLSLIKLNSTEIDNEHCSFHLPLHRHVAVFMHHAVTHQSVNIEEMLPQDTLQLKNMIAHPLQTLIAFQHIMAGLWVSNGLQIKTQAINYMQPHFCNSTIDADLFLIQQAATRIRPDEFIDMFASSYGLKQYMYIYPIASTPMDQEKLVAFLENAFTFLAILVTQQINLGLPISEITRKEMISLLAISDKTHSQIHETREALESTTHPVCLGLRSEYLHPCTPVTFLHRPFCEAINESMVSQHLLSIVIFLMEMTLIEDEKKTDNFGEPLEQTTIDSVCETVFENWFPTDDIIDNFLVTFKKFQTSEIKFENDGFKTKFLENLFNSLMSEDFNMIRGVDDENEEEESPTVQLENDEDEDDQENRQRERQHTLNQLSWADYVCGGDEDILPTGGSSSPRLSFSKSKPLKFEYDVDESILSALLKLYSKLNEKRDSFKTDQESLDSFDWSSRIGDGPYFIGCLIKRYIHAAAKRIELKKLSLSIDEADNVHPSRKECIAEVIAVVDDTRRRIWPNLVKPKTKVSSEVSSSSSASDHVASTSAGTSKATEMEVVDAEELERAEKKRRAFELKAQIMNKFRTMQNAFMESNKSQMGEDSGKNTQENSESNSASGSGGEQSSTDQSPSSEANPVSGESQVKYNAASYQCVICGVTDVSTLERSFVQIVLLQSTSILGNAQAHPLSEDLTGGSSMNVESTSARNKSSVDDLPSTSRISTSEEEQTQFVERKTFANFFERRLDALFSEFSVDSWLRSFNIGWCGGVHTQSCGHFMHMDCYQSFITSTYQTRETTDLIEYSCPLCRKTANSVLPIIPNFANLYALVKSRSNSCPLGIANEILELLSNGDTSRLANTTEDESKFLKVLAMAIEDVMKATEPQYRNIRVDPSPQSLFLFLSSISRTNLEYHILLWRENLIRSNQQTSCFTLSLNAKLVLPMHYIRLWSQITGIQEDRDKSDTLLPYEKNVPLLLKDVSAILLQLLYALPFNIDKAYFISITQALLNLNFIQALVVITYQMPLEQRMEICSKVSLAENSNMPKSFDTISDYIALIMNNNYEGKPNSLKSTTCTVPENQSRLTEDVILSSIAKTCLPFLRVASILYHLLYLEPTLPEYQSIADCSSPLEEFTTLTTFLKLNSHKKTSSEEISEKQVQFFHPFINWIESPSPVGIWFREFDKFFQAKPAVAQTLIKESFIISHKPRLLQLPASYDQLFMYYHKRTCGQCGTVPKDASICLICGALVCIRDTCCRTANTYEGVMHSKKCGAGTAIYLAINSSSIIVIRGKKACIWGSVYLDEFGEEDRDLKRGKPLYLSGERYRVLEQQYLSHSFVHTSKKWVFHKDSL
ncbi:E3 ubiquitin-protein ligase ubr3, partial [Tyrophagus putrescentiae]